MNDNICSESAERASMWSRGRLSLAMLLCLHIFTCCVSLTCVSDLYAYEYKKIITVEGAHIFGAVVSVASFAPVALLFLFSRFNFGYFLGFFFYTMILGYLWIIPFSQSNYDHSLAHISIYMSALTFLIPTLLVVSPIKQRFVLSTQALDHLLSFILVLAAATVAISAFYNFKLVTISKIYEFRNEIEFPGLIRYSIGITSNALLPFAFACYVARGNPWRAGAALLFLLLLYPITLTKLALFAPCWLMFIMLLSKFAETRVVVVLSLLLPMLSGILSVILAKSGLISFKLMTEYFGVINTRMIAMPSLVLDLYSEFFSTHPLTHFCQILLLKPLVACPYVKPLSVIMNEAYSLGNLNASLFATEGIASVGPILAPLSALVCGLVITLGNRLSSGLPPKFILLSGGILPHVFLNVPLSTMLLTNGAACLFLLWYVTPRSMFETKALGPAGSAASRNTRTSATCWVSPSGIWTKLADYIPRQAYVLGSLPKRVTST